jgi:polysaccharide export outer membrane protein
MVKKKAERSIYVMGLVRKPDEFEMPLDRDMRLLDALAMAGGRTMEVADKVHIIRNLPEQDQPIVVQASVNEAKRDAAANIRLAAGDVVSVEETPLTFTIDTLRSFIRFGFSSTVPGF